MPTKILITEENKYPEDALQKLCALGEVTAKKFTQKEFEEVIGEYDIILTGLGLHFSAEVLQKAARLKLLAAATTGIDHIDSAYAAEKDIKVISLKGEGEAFLEHVTATAELCWGLLLALVRHVVPAAESVKRYEWNRAAYEGNELSGKTLGVVGLGRLGKHVARYGKAFLMDVIAYDPYVAPEVFEKCGVARVTLEELLKRADVISLQMVLNDKTKGMIGAGELSLMKPSAVLINTARGAVVDEAAVLAALQNKTIAGYATDVLANETGYHENFTHDPLVEYAKMHDNCLIVPHLGGMAVEAAWKTRRFIADKVIRTWAEI